RSLEETFDVELFLRIENTTKLTDAGETLFGITRTLFGCQQGAIDLLRNGGQIGVQKLRIGAANLNAIMPMVKRLEDRLSQCQLFPHHRTARGNSAPADQFQNRRGRIWPPANGPVG
ncbi:MAG: hypothetical protein VYD85_00950, partial [Pseudomonadota bacterium]|nr:hypothetical protein [Pseudomonadota bacterium]